MPRTTPAWGAKRLAIPYISYAIWYVTDNVDPSWHPYTLLC